VLGVYRNRSRNIRHVSLSAVEDEMILGILIGLFVGVNAGFLIAALCNAAGREPEVRWIPASDPPKVSERYLCYDKEYGRITYAWVDESWWYGDRMCSRDEYVTHYMPLPLSPEPEE
jgi:hypothetical protein